MSKPIIVTFTINAVPCRLVLKPDSLNDDSWAAEQRAEDGEGTPIWAPIRIISREHAMRFAASNALCKLMEGGGTLDIGTTVV